MSARLPVNLMLVEDERIVAFDLKRQLQGFGYKVGSVVASGEQALARAEDEPPDLVVMDIHIEGRMDGIQVATEIQARHKIPVVFLTAFAEDETLRRALNSRPFGYLVKPCEARELHATIQMALARRDVELAVEESEMRLKLALDAASLGVLEWQPQSNRLTADGHLSVLYGDMPTPLDESWEGFICKVHPEDRERVEAALLGTLDNGSAICLSFRTIPSQKLPCFVEAHAKAYRGRDVVRIVGILQDITQRQADQDRLRQSSVVFQTTAEAIVITDASRKAVASNAAFTRITGFSEQELLGQEPDLLLRIRRERDARFDALETSSEGYWHGEVGCHRKDGEPFPAWQSISVVRNSKGSITHYVTAFSDVSAIYAAQQKLQYLAHHDPLTGLPNRILLDDRIVFAIEQARREQRRCPVLYLDLDGFKVVNDNLGHKAGDDLLRTVAARLTAVLRATDTVGRVGGDEFVILPGSGNPEDVEQLGEKILTALRTPIAIAGELITVSASLGVAVFPDHGATHEQLLQAADMAMYAAKADGRNRLRFYADDMSVRSRERMVVEQGLRRALDGTGLEVQYQPQVSFEDGRIIGVEALARWRQADGSIVSPAAFIPVAEACGIIEQLGCAVLQKACEDVLGILGRDGRQIRLGVNVSAQQFMQDDFAGMVQATLARTRFPPESLELEITESTLQTIDRSQTILKALKRMGVSISIDDFGTGYSSFSVLRDLPVDRIKIDRSFIINLPEHAEQSTIVGAIVALGLALQMGIIVEGVERPEQVSLLKQMGCHEGQGYLFSEPIDRTALCRLVACDLTGEI